eukprot:TRINITY_DN15731_c0_g1_i1.p1 TRINITY_DN15731_c0_g1~~TRINITY_DN15731_c0_g1_i1.p1  ORF type:complete len:242 (-),score=103.50 TRINITY_DN15731_c0_g1_i1:220-945(-)
MKIHVAALVLSFFILLSCVNINCQNEPNFDLYEFLYGEWNINQQLRNINSVDKEMNFELDYEHEFALNITGNEYLFGEFFDSEGERLAVKLVAENEQLRMVFGDFEIDFDADEFAEEEEDEDENDSVLFEFEKVGYGKYTAFGQSKHSAFELTVQIPVSFTLQVFSMPEEGQQSIQTYYGNKVIHQPEPSFFKKYGFMIGIGVVMIFNMMRGRAQQPPAAAPVQDGEGNQEASPGSDKKEE